jgi:hypothetical protein
MHNIRALWRTWAQARLAHGGGADRTEVVVDAARLRGLRGALVAIRAHSVSHPRLTRVAPERARAVTRQIWIGTQRQSGWPFRRSRREDDCRASWWAPNSTGLVDNFFSAIAVDIHFEDRRVMDEAVDRREGHGLIRENFAPFTEW